jgi:hypothetical protein
VFLIWENRPDAGVYSLSELSPKLRQAVIRDKEADGATIEDAETLAKNLLLAPGPVGFDDFVQSAAA